MNYWNRVAMASRIGSLAEKEARLQEQLDETRELLAYYRAQFYGDEKSYEDDEVIYATGCGSTAS